MSDSFLHSSSVSPQKVKSLANSKEHPERNETEDYESVIKQFDDLISELSESKRFVNYPQNLSSSGEGDIIKESIMTDYKTGYYDKQLTHLVQREKTSLKSFVKESKTSDKKTVPYITAEQCTLTDKPSSCNNENNFPGVQERVPWINSHLWDLENKRDTSQLLKLQSKAEENIPVDVGTVNIKGNDISLPMYVTKMAEKEHVPSFSYYSKQVQTKDKNPDYKRVEKFNAKTFSYAEKHFRENSLYDSRIQASNTLVASSLLKSPKVSRSPASKYLPLDSCFLVKLYIETKDLHLGPFSFEIYPKMSLRLLKLKVEQEHGIKCSLQRWILGKCFALDNEKSLADYNVLPGSSIIVYVDHKQKVLNDDEQNEMTAEKSSFAMSKKTDRKKDGKTFDNSTNVHKCRKTRELARKDSFDLKCPPSNSKTDAVCQRNFSSRKYDGDKLDFSAKNQSLRTDKICSPVAKRKLFKACKNFKTKTEISEYEKQDLLAKGDEQFSMNAPNIESFENYNDEFVSCVKKSLSENESSNLSDLEHLNKITNEFQPIFMNHNENASGSTFTDNSNSSTVSANQSNSNSESFNNVQIVKNNIMYSNVALFNNTDNINNEFKDIGMTRIQSDNEYSEAYFENLKSSLKESNSLKNSDIKTEKLDYSYNHMDEKDKSFSKDENAGDTNNANKSNSRNFCLVKEQNVESIKANLSSNKICKSIKNGNAVNNFEIHSSRLQSEHCLQLNTLEKFGNDNNLPEASNNKIKCKQSVTSLIRKLSLTRKGKSLDDNICSQKHISSEIQCDEIEDNKEALTSDVNKSAFGDVHIEISSQDPSTILAENNTELYMNEKMQVQGDSLVKNMDSEKNFELLLKIENMDLVENTTTFTCPVCFDEFAEGQGVILHDCLHIFCRDCLSNSVYHADSAIVKCPYRDDFYSCESHLQQREIKALVSEEVYETYLQRSVITAEGLEDKSFHCKTPDCRGWCIYDNAINVFHCPVCSHYNCLNCQAIHEGLNCRQYQDKLKIQQKLDKESEKTLELLNQMIQSGKALHCPKCDVILLKKWGCDWLKCSVCKTEICWITKGPRWGPAGQGDISGGCRCGVNGVKCHPSCTYCH